MTGYFEYMQSPFLQEAKQAIEKSHHLEQEKQLLQEQVRMYSCRAFHFE